MSPGISDAAPPDSPPRMTPDESLPAPTYRAGTLVYTRAGLFSLFFWLLAGDFVFSLMDTVEPRLLPLILKQYGATNEQIAIIVTSIAAAMNSIVNPIVSYRSDRTQTRWGRRRPYLAVATPFLAIFLALTPFAPEILHALLKVSLIGSLLHMSPVAPILLMFGTLVVLYQIFNMVIGSIYYYILRDVVPLPQLGKMTSLFRVFGYIAAFVFNFWIFGRAERHSREIFVGISLCYAIGFLLMCWKVKEGRYEHVEDTVKEGHGLGRVIRNYFKESFGPPIYRWVYATRVFALSSASAGTFAVFFARDQLHLDLDTVGRLAAWPILFCLPLAYPFGVLLDRWGAIRSLGLTVGLMIVSNALGYLFIQDRTSLLIFSILITSAGFIFNIAQSVFLQTMFHPDRIGQLSSANAVLAALVGIALGPLCGALLDRTKDYRLVYLWPVCFCIATGYSLYRVSQHWHNCGGPGNYQPPLGESYFARP